MSIVPLPPARAPVLEGELIPREVWSTRDRRAALDALHQLRLWWLAFLLSDLVHDLEAIHAGLREIGQVMAQLRKDAEEVSRRLDRILLMVEAIAHHLGVEAGGDTP